VTDRQKLTALLSEWGVPYVQEDIPSQPGERSVVCVRVGRVADLPDSATVTGYSGFFTDFEFGTEGEFVRMGAWE
jgi:hypothetical protein